jgi:hypothetical protein
VMATLNTYMKDVQRLLRDARQELINPHDIVEYINTGRREIAMRAECIRRLTPISGSLISATVTAGGSGYTSVPTVTVTAPDYPSGDGPFPNGDQATALALISLGAVVAVDIQYGGQGYFKPTLAFSGGGGTGAAATPVLSFINQLKQGQEVYNFGDVDLSMFPGVDSIYMIKSVSLLFSNFRYSLACYDFSTYQALIRQYALTAQYVPAACAQYGQGVGGSFYMYPIPSQAYQLEFDCLCLPSDLTTDLSVEALPAPWTDAVKYWAAHMCYLNLQNFNAAKFYLDLFDTFVLRYSTYARRGRRINPYGRP